MLFGATRTPKNQKTVILPPELTWPFDGELDAGQPRLAQYRCLCRLPQSLDYHLRPRPIHPPYLPIVCRLAGILNIREHIAQTCRSLTISVYHIDEEEYGFQCTDLIEYATKDPHRIRLLPGAGRYRTQEYALPSMEIAHVIRTFIPRITVLHFVLLDCTATYGAWDVSEGFPLLGPEYPLSLTELHVTFAYTSPPPALLLDAPRGTFFPPSSGQIGRCRFDGIRKLVIRDANADFVAFLTTACPRLERVESTAEFRAEDVPPDVPADVKDRLVFVRLPRTVTWGLTGSDAKPISKGWPAKTFAEWRRMTRRKPLTPVANTSSKPKRKLLWRFFTRVIFGESES
ncbi:hypothetical protein C8R46DRAFT_1219057 [Mycena filopes]|nr:hypothetical protein C8R46DRAFT_1219057 [Mycena filopes]